MNARDTSALRTKLQAAIDASAEWSAASLSTAIGRNASYIRDFLRERKESIGATDLASIEKTLGLRSGELLELIGFQAPPAGLGEPLQQNYIAGADLVGPKDLPVYAAAMGGKGHLIISADAIDMVKRPQPLLHVKGAYGILITGESMVPAFRPGDIALVSPRMPPDRGQDVVLYHTPPNGEAEAMVKHLLGWTDDKWKLEQYNPAKKFSEDRLDWPVCHWVVGKYNRR